MKRKLLFLAALAVSALGFNVNAQPEKPALPVPASTQLVDDGNTEQYLYNVDAGAFFLGANQYYARASVSKNQGYRFKVAKNSDGVTWMLHDYVEKTESWASPGWKAVFADNAESIWVDNVEGSNSKTWVITHTDGDKFKISNPSAGEGNLAVVPSKGDTRLYLSAAAEAQDTWVAVSPEAYSQFLTELDGYQAVYDQYLKDLKEQYVAGNDIIDLAPATWVGQGGTYGPGVERYQTSSLGEGDVLTQTIEGLKNGRYTVTLKLAASYTSTNGGVSECPTGDDLSVGFVQDKTENLPVKDRAGVGDNEYDIITLTADVTNGELKYGIKNIASSGNWYVAAVTSIVYEGPVYAVSVTEVENGKVTAVPTKAMAGETVTLTIEPAEGYELDDLAVTYGEGTAVEVAEGYTFTMPEGDVTVTAEFGLLPAAPEAETVGSWDFTNYGTTDWLLTDTEAEGIVVFDKTVYPSKNAKYTGIYAENEKLRLDKATGIRAYSKGSAVYDVLAIPALKKGDVIEVVCNAGGGTGTDQVITSVTENATLTVNSWDNFTITMNEDGDLGIIPIFYNTNTNWYSIATINVTRPVAPQYLANPSFELSALDTPLENELKYKEEIPEIYGWTIAGLGVGKDSYSDVAILKKDGEPLNPQFGTSAPSEGDYSFFTRQGWNSNATITLTSDKLEKLPAGGYLLSVDYKQCAGRDNDGQKNNNTYVNIALNSEGNVLASTDSERFESLMWANVANYFNNTDWSTVVAPIYLDSNLKAGSQVVITCHGGGAHSTGFYLDNVQLIPVAEEEALLMILEQAIEATQAKADSYSVGNGLFQYAEAEMTPINDAIAEAQAAYEAAESKEEMIAAIEAINAAAEAFAPVQNTPKEGRAYIIGNVTAVGTTLSVNESSVTLGENTEVYFTAVEGGYAISNAEYQYITKGSNDWSLSTTAELANAWIVKINLYDAEAGHYTLEGVANNKLIGTDDKEVGKPVYRDKSVDKNGLWTITEVALEYTITVGEAGYATYVTTDDVTFDAEGLEAYTVVGINEDNTVELEAVTEAAAGTPVIVKAEAKDYTIHSVVKAAKVESDYLFAAGEEGVPAADGIYVLAQPADNPVGFYALNEGQSVPAGKAYLKVAADDTIDPAEVKFIGFEGNGDATAIELVEVAPATVENGVYYNLAGQRVQNPVKGIYIVNGKKVLVK